MATCVDLKSRFSDRYRVVYEDSYAEEYGARGRAHDPWLFLIPCQYGHIYPHGGELLGASTNHRGPIARALAALPFVWVVQDGSDGINAVFCVDKFEEVAEILKPRVRRRITPEHRERLVAAGAKNRFVVSPGSGAAGGDRRRDPSLDPLPEAA